MNKDTTITFRCDTDFKVRLEKMARRFHTSVGEVLIECVLHGYQGFVTDQKAKEAKSIELGENVRQLQDE
jgi:hypothetical protein